MYPGRVERANLVPAYVIGVVLVATLLFATWAIASAYVDLKDREVTSSMIGDGTVVSADIADGTIATALTWRTAPSPPSA